MSNKPTLLVEAPFYETPEKVSSRYRSPPYAETLRKIESLFSRRREYPLAGYIYRPVVIEPRYDSGLAKANKRVFTVEI